MSEAIYCATDWDIFWRVKRNGLHYFFQIYSPHISPPPEHLYNFKQ